MQLPEFSASAASQALHRQLIEEHVDEAAFLYEQRRALLADADAPWTRVAGTERRIEAHLDALAIAGRGALEACVARAIESTEPGALFVATCLACRRRDSIRLAQVLDAVQDGDEAALSPVRDAFRVELPDEWTPLVLKRLSASRPAWVALLAGIARTAEPRVVRALLTALEHRICVVSVADALARLQVEAARQPLWQCLGHQDAGTREAALLSLCRLGDAEAPLHAVAAAHQQPWARTAAVVSGGRVAVPAFLELATGDAAQGAALEALGLLGDPEAVPALLAALSRDDQAVAAARALHWITGAALFEEAFVPDPVDEAAMSPAELEHWKTSQHQPTRADGQPFGETVRVLTHDPRRWEHWLDKHRLELRPGRRYRAGRPCTARVTVDSLADPGSGGRLRRAAALELDIRYGCPIAFDPFTPVATQRTVLACMRAWADAQSDRFEPGAWTYGRQEQQGPS